MVARWLQTLESSIPSCADRRPRSDKGDLLKSDVCRLQRRSSASLADGSGWRLCWKFFRSLTHHRDMPFLSYGRDFVDGFLMPGLS